jgi:hypothetical protein
MRNRRISIIKGLFVTSDVGALLTTDTNKTSFPTHDSVIVSTLVVKDHGESLLIELPRTTPWLAELGNTLLLSITGVFPTSFDSFRQDMQVNNSSSYEVSFS